MTALKSQEHSDLMEQFERQFRSGHIVGSGRLDREKDKALWARGHIYEDPRVNEAFLAFRSGCAFGRAVERSSEALREPLKTSEIAYQVQVLTEHGLLEEFGPLIGGALLSYLAEAVAASREQGWQPMETAPKDGTRVLVTAGAVPWVSYWRSEPFGAWMHVWDAATLTPRPFGPITHWMPLPSPPKETT